MERTRVTLGDGRWLGQSVVRLKGTLSELTPEMPRFRRADFTYGNALNEFLDLILREPEPDDERLVPVATVSKRYGLIQHSEAIEWLCDAYAEQKWDPSSMPATAWLSEYGERLRVQVATPHVPIRMTESDVIRANLFLWNSVDRSRSFELAINWVRLICTNGLTIDGEDRLRKVHNADWMSRTSAVEFLRERLPRSADKVALLKEWLEVEVPKTRLLAWVDGDLARKWGKVRAARVWHIIRTGHDGAVGRSSEATRASNLHVSPLDPVPGAPPNTTDAYHIYQALLWIAGKEVSIDRQESLTDEAQRLVSPLVLAA